MEENGKKNLCIITTNTWGKALRDFVKVAENNVEVTILYTDNYVATVQYLVHTILKGIFSWMPTDTGEEWFTNKKCKFNEYKTCKNKDCKNHETICVERVRMNCKKYVSKYQDGKILSKFIIVEKVGQGRDL